MRVRQALLGAVAAAVVLVAVLDVAEVVHIGHAGGGPVNVLPSSQSTMLYDIPNFVYQRTQMHFPQAEENWLNMAAEGKIGDDVKPQKILTNLNGIISDARTHALTENYAARVQAKKDALEENYDVYDVHKGKVVHKIYGKQVGGSMTLKPVGEQGQMLAQRQAQQPATQQQHRGTTLAFGVVVPGGLEPGAKFIAQIPGHGQELVTVPAGVHGGQQVAIRVPVKPAAKPTIKQQRKSAARFAKVLHSAKDRQAAVRRQTSSLPRVGKAPHIKTSHPLAARMFVDSLAGHYNSVNHKVYGLEH